MDLTISSIVRTGNSSTIDSFDGEHNIYSFSPISSVVVRKFSHDISLENFLTEKETKLKDTNKYDDISDSEESAFEDMSDNYVEWNIALSPSLGTDDLQFLIRNFEEQEDYDNPEKDEHISGKKTSNYCIFIGIENSEMVSEEEKSNFVYKDNICVKNESLKDIKSNTDDGQFNVNNSLKNQLEKAEKEKFELMEYILKLESKIKLLTLENELLTDELNESAQLRSQK